MINFSFNLVNPFSDPSKFKTVYTTSSKTWNPHKFWDFSICKDSSIIRLTFDFTIKEDHAGFGFDFAILGWGIDFRFYDHRHWDYENNCWEVYE